MVGLKSLLFLGFASLSLALPQPSTELAKTEHSNSCDMDPVQNLTKRYFHFSKFNLTHGDVNTTLCKGKDSGEWTLTFILDTKYDFFGGPEEHRSTAAILDTNCKVRGLYEFKHTNPPCGPNWNIQADFFGKDSPLQITSWSMDDTNYVHWAKIAYTVEYAGSTYTHEKVEGDVIDKYQFRNRDYDIWWGLLSYPIAFRN